MCVFHLLVVALLWRGTAAAEPIELRWEAPRSCPKAAAVEARISALLGPESAGEEPVRARVRIEHVPPRYRLQLWLTTAGHEATRVLRAESCDELTDTVAWLIALAIDPEIAAPTREPNASPAPANADGGSAPRVAPGAGTTNANGANGSQRAPANGKQAARPAAASAQAPDHASPDADNQADARRKAAEEERKGNARAPEQRDEARSPKAKGPPLPRGVHAGAAAGIFSGGGAGTQAALGISAGLSVGWSYTQARFSGLLPRDVEVAPGASARVWSLQLELAECAMWGSTVRVGPCVILGGLRTSAEGRGLSRETERAAFWGIASAGLQLFWRVRGRLALSLAASAGIPITPRPRFTVTGLGPVVEAEPWSVDARLGLAFASP